MRRTVILESRVVTDEGKRKYMPLSMFLKVELGKKTQILENELGRLLCPPPQHPPPWQRRSPEHQKLLKGPLKAGRQGINNKKKWGTYPW